MVVVDDSAPLTPDAAVDIAEQAGETAVEPEQAPVALSKIDPRSGALLELTIHPPFTGAQIATFVDAGYIILTPPLEN
jgi:hypothetical protein